MKHIRIPSVWTIALCALISVSAACDDDPTGPDFLVGTVDVSTDAETIEIGSTAQLEVEVRDASGVLIDPDDVDIVFTSSSQTVATVSETGLVTPVGPGSATITVTVGTVSDTITINVISEISSIVITETELDLVTDETSSFQITVLDAEGDPVVDPSLTFTSSNASIVSVDEDGVVTAEEAGTATITVSGGGESDTIEITVHPASEGNITVSGTRFTALAGEDVAIGGLVVVTDAGGVVIPGADLLFTPLDPTILTVDATGLLSPLAAGTTLVTVTSDDDPTGSATFRVNVLTAGSVDVFEIDPVEATIAVDGTTDLALVAETDGTEIDDLLVTFSSSDETVATVDPLTGEVTGVAAGTATITATLGALTAEAEITVE